MSQSLELSQILTQKCHGNGTRTKFWTKNLILRKQAKRDTLCNSGPPSSTVTGFENVRLRNLRQVYVLNRCSSNLTTVLRFGKSSFSLQGVMILSHGRPYSRSGVNFSFQNLRRYSLFFNYRTAFYKAAASKIMTAHRREGQTNLGTELRAVKKNIFLKKYKMHCKKTTNFIPE